MLETGDDQILKLVKHTTEDSGSKMSTMVSDITLR